MKKREDEKGGIKEEAVGETGIERERDSKGGGRYKNKGREKRRKVNTL